MIICLAGFSGSGKSTLLKSLADDAPKHWNFKDLDLLVLARLKTEYSSAAEELGAAIREVGLEKFRRAELEVLKEVLTKDSERDLVLALGGGTLSRGLTPIKECKEARLVGLDIDFETCWSRISKDSNRPLTALGKEEMHEKFTRRRVALLQADLVLEAKELNSPPSLQSLIEKLKAD